jgi:hypothetical protein
MSRADDKNSTKYWFDRQTPGLSLLCADFTTHEYPAHIHDALMIAVTEAGGSEIKASGVPDEAHSAALLVVNPAEPLQPDERQQSLALPVVLPRAIRGRRRPALPRYR